MEWLSLIVNLPQSGITRGEDPNEELSRSGWLCGHVLQEEMCVGWGDHLDDVNWDAALSGWHQPLGLGPVLY